jgi:hypothetical protein
MQRSLFSTCVYGSRLNLCQQQQGLCCRHTAARLQQLISRVRLLTCLPCMVGAVFILQFINVVALGSPDVDEISIPTKQ